MTPAALDITIAIILLLSAIVAYFRGLIREIFTIVALMVASFAAYMGGDMMIPSFDKWLHVNKKAGAEAANAVSKAAASGTDATLIAQKHLIFGVIDPALASVVCAYASVFVFFYLVMSLVGYFISRSVAESGLGLFDKLLGGVFGLARGYLVIFLFFVPISFLIGQEKFPEWAKNSVSVPILEQTLVFADDKLNLTENVKKAGDEFKEKVQHIDLTKIRKEVKDKAAKAEEKAREESSSEDVQPDEQKPDDELKQELLQEERKPGAPQ